MDAKEAYIRRKKFFGRPCHHPQIEKEYEQGVNIGEYMCTICGSEFAKKDIWEQIHQVQEQQRDDH